MKDFFKKIIDKIKSLDKGTICRTIIQVCAFANEIIAVAGRITMQDYANNVAYQVISLIVTILAASASYWYNNNWSNLALLFGDMWDMVKDGKVTMDEIKEFIAKHKGHDTIEEDTDNKENEE